MSPVSPVFYTIVTVSIPKHGGLQWFLYSFNYDASGLAWLPIYTWLPTPTRSVTIFLLLKGKNKMGGGQEVIVGWE